MPRPFILILPLMLMAGCQAEPIVEPQAQQKLGPPPAELCEKVREALDELRKTAAFDYDDQGGATIEQRAWFALGETKRDQLGQALAFHAACAVGELEPEQTATVRSETRIVLMQRLFPMTADTGSLLSD